MIYEFYISVSSMIRLEVAMRWRSPAELLHTDKQGRVRDADCCEWGAAMYVSKTAFGGERPAIEKGTLDFVERLEQYGTANDIHAGFQSFIENFGFDNAVCVRLPDPGEELAACVMLNSRPEEWSNGYAARDYFRADPMARELSRSFMPFAWSDLVGARAFSSVEVDVMRWAAEFGMHNGFVVPIFEASGNVAVMSIAGKVEEVDETTRSALTLASIYTHNRLATLLRQGLDFDASLTRREVECLRWVAEGKSDWEIGQILSISDKTVNYHVENVKRKYNVATRIQAVVAALRQGKLPH